MKKVQYYNDIDDPELECDGILTKTDPTYLNDNSNSKKVILIIILIILF